MLLTVREAAPRPCAASAVSGKGNRELETQRTVAEEISWTDAEYKARLILIPELQDVILFRTMEGPVKPYPPFEIHIN